MRVWESENRRLIPSDLVREQDFILRVRRMQRTGIPTLVLNFVLNAVDHLAKNAAALEEAQRKLHALADASQGIYSDMSNGDVFIAWESNDQAQALAQRLMETMFPDETDATSQILLTFMMPTDYTRLRERTNHYVEIVRTAASVGVDLIKMGAAQGQLTAKNVDQIEQLLGEIDMRPYGRTQLMYRYDRGVWHAIGEEYFISFEDLQRERFPKLEFASSQHFFLALCGSLDQRLLGMLSTHTNTIAGKTINLNLAVSSVIHSVFAGFVRAVPRAQRGLIGFELHRGDLLQDFSLTLSAIDLLRREGFRVIVDGITPDMLPYVDLGLLNVDTIKINVSKERVFELDSPAVRAAVARLPVEKIVFFRTDNERALAVGHELGVTHFQGWLIDDLAGKKKV